MGASATPAEPSPTASLPEWFGTALRAHQTGQLEEAEAAYLSILEHDPAHAGAWHLLGVLDHQRGRLALAAERIAKALGLDPHKAVYHNNYGVALKSLGRLDEAIAAYREALRRNSAYADAHANLGAAFYEAGATDDANDAFRAALQLQPDHADALYNFANLLAQCGHRDEAIELYQRAHRAAPGRADVLNNLGNALLAADRGEEALAAYHAALTRDPDRAETLDNLGRALVALGREHEAPRWFAEPARLRPHPHAWPIRITALCPTVFPSAQAIERYRADLEAVLDAHRGAALGPDPASATTAGCCPSFFLAHHGHDDRRLRAKFAALYRDDAPRPASHTSRARPRLGFVVTHTHEGPFLRCIGGILEHLAPGRFEPIVFGDRRGMALLKQEIRNPEAVFAPFPDDPRGARERIAAASCDLLYHWEVGTDALNYLLPFARLAPVQCTSWGIQVTTGVPAVDHYLSSDLVEAPGTEAHYTERLVRLPTLLSYRRRLERPGPPAAPEEFGLPADRTIYACLQRPAKIHPDFDPLLADILQRDPKGIVVLLKGRPGDRAGDRLAERFRTTMADVRDRVVMLPELAAIPYRRLLARADVVLDPIPYGSGSSCYDIFSFDLPLVTWPGPYNAGRYALACYRRMGLEDLVVNSAETYVDLAVRLGTDRDARQAVVARIVAASPALFEDLAVVRAHETYFEAAVAEARAATARG
jgi:predicted O-linked N-acetylglucosamine transferase (SPINDLY family)